MGFNSALTNSAVSTPGGGAAWASNPQQVTDALVKQNAQAAGNVQAPSVSGQLGQVMTPDNLGDASSLSIGNQLDNQMQATDNSAPVASAQMAKPGFGQATADQTSGIGALANPRLSKLGKLMSLLLTAGRGAAAGSQYANFGQGFQAAEQAPIQMAEQQQQLAGIGLQNQKTQAQIAQMKNTIPVSDPISGATYNIPQTAIPAYLRTAITESGKNNRNSQTIDSREGIADNRNATTQDIADTKNLTALRKQGLGADNKPIPYEDLTPAEQASQDLKSSQAESQDALAQLNRAKNDPTSPAYKVAFARLQVSRENAATAAGKLGLDKTKYLGDYYGVGADMQPLPGAPANPDNPQQAQGLKTAAITKPTAKARDNANVADQVLATGDRIKQELQNPAVRDAVGKFAGRYTNLQDFIGSLPPQAQGLKTDLASYSAFVAGMHPIRGIGAIQHFEHVVGRADRGADSIASAIDEMAKNAHQMKQQGTIKTVAPASSNKYSELGFVPLNGGTK